MADEKSQSTRQGWKGDPEGHRNAGKKSPTKFKKGDLRAREAGAKGGKRAQQSGNAHQFTAEERRSGGRNSRGKKEATT